MGPLAVAGNRRADTAPSSVTSEQVEGTESDGPGAPDEQDGPDQQGEGSQPDPADEDQ